jgi:hypothetical protein
MTVPVQIIANAIQGMRDQTRLADQTDAEGILATLHQDGWQLIKLADMAVARRNWAFMEGGE